MTIESFQSILTERIPTAREFSDFANSQGWRFRLNGPRLQMLVPPDDLLARGFARLLAREPYRTRVWELAGGKPVAALPEPPRAIPEPVKPIEAPVEPIERPKEPEREAIVNAILKRSVETGRKVWGSSAKNPVEAARQGRARLAQIIPDDWSLICFEGDPEWTRLPVEVVDD